MIVKKNTAYKMENGATLIIRSCPEDANYKKEKPWCIVEILTHFADGRYEVKHTTMTLQEIRKVFHLKRGQNIEWQQ